MMYILVYIEVQMPPNMQNMLMYALKILHIAGPQPKVEILHYLLIQGVLQ